MAFYGSAVRRLVRPCRSPFAERTMFLCTHVDSRKFLVFGILLLVFFFVLGILVLTTDVHFSHLVTGPPPKIILSWTPYFNDVAYLPRTLSGLGCVVDTCVTTFNRSKMSVSDAVIFHWRDIKDVPYKTNPKHKWVLYNYEAPPHVDWNQLKPIIGNMTWVATYRSDSDLVTPYGLYRWKPPQRHGSYHRWTQSEFESKKSIGWLVSNCHTPGKREVFVNLLKRHIEVDVLGKCGSLAPCEKGKSRIFCYRKLAKRYKFYLSFENSLCRDYATEKVFLPLTVGLVPVVFGGANYSHILPPNSFIDALAFQTPKDLADYLLEVGSNFTLYQSYQKWREHYEIVQNEAPDYYWLCELCRLLNDEKQQTSVVRMDQDSFYDWWFVGGACTSWKKPTDYSTSTYSTSIYNGSTVS